VVPWSDERPPNGPPGFKPRPVEEASAVVRASEVKRRPNFEAGFRKESENFRLGNRDGPAKTFVPDPEGRIGGLEVEAKIEIDFL